MLEATTLLTVDETKYSVMKECLVDMGGTPTDEPCDDHDEKSHTAITVLSQLRKQEHGSSKVLVDRYHASTAADELDLIQAIKGLESDPPTDGVFGAHDHLWGALDDESEDEE